MAANQTVGNFYEIVGIVTRRIVWLPLLFATVTWGISGYYSMFTEVAPNAQHMSSFMPHAVSVVVVFALVSIPATLLCCAGIAYLTLNKTSDHVMQTVSNRAVIASALALSQGVPIVLVILRYGIGTAGATAEQVASFPTITSFRGLIIIVSAVSTLAWCASPHLKNKESGSAFGLPLVLWLIMSWKSVPDVLAFQVWWQNLLLIPVLGVVGGFLGAISENLSQKDPPFSVFLKTLIVCTVGPSLIIAICRLF